MPWRDAVTPTEMSRVAVVAPLTLERRVLVEVADAGVVEPDPTGGVAPNGDDDGPSLLTADPPATTEDRADLARGERSLQAVAADARRTERCLIVTGWTPADQVEPLATRLAPLGGAVARLHPRRGVEPPTAHQVGGSTGTFRPLVTTYGTVPYRDIDPTWFAVVAYMLMFGMMFGDVGHGLILVVFGWVALRTSGRVGRLRPVAPFLIGAGLAAVGFGLVYGEAFGPTGLVPTLWINPLDEPETLLLAGLVFGSCLLAITFVIATVDRWREGGAKLALYSASGLGGALLFAGGIAAVVGVLVGNAWLLPIGVATTTIGSLLIFAGFLARAGSGGSAIAQAVVEMFDTVLRMGSNLVSFTRLAAFGLTHAVIALVVWDGTAALWERGGIVARSAALALFVVGNAVAFGLGGLVAGIQALRLEYYEMFSRLFTSEGRPFHPWHVPLDRLEAS